MPSTNVKKFGIIGAGVMGTAIASNLLRQKVARSSQLIMSDKNQVVLKKRQQQLGVRIAKDNFEVAAQSDYIILAIKPQDFAALAHELSVRTPGKKIFFSIMAGVSLAQLKKQLRTPRVIRAMPNLAGKIGQAFVVWKSGYTLNREEKQLVNSVFGSLGQSVAVAKEDDINKATAMSGSGPAYLYYFMELLIAAARDLGFSRVLARTIVEQTIRGAWAVYEQSGLTPAELREQVTSKRGTTEAAIKSFQKNNLPAVIKKGIKAAYRRAQELSR